MLIQCHDRDRYIDEYGQGVHAIGLYLFDTVQCITVCDLRPVGVFLQEILFSPSNPVFFTNETDL